MLCTFLRTVNLTKWHERSQDRKGKREGWFLSLVSVTTVLQENRRSLPSSVQVPGHNMLWPSGFFLSNNSACPHTTYFLLLPSVSSGRWRSCCRMCTQACILLWHNCLVLVLKCCYTEKQRLWWEKRLQVVHLLPVVFLSFHNSSIWLPMKENLHSSCPECWLGFFFWMDVTILDGFCHYCDLRDFSFRTQRFAFSGHHLGL